MQATRRLFHKAIVSVLLLTLAVIGTGCAPASDIPVYGPADRLSQFTVQQATATGAATATATALPYPVPTGTGYPGPTATPTPGPTTNLPTSTPTTAGGTVAPTNTPKIPLPDTATPTPVDVATATPNPTHTPRPTDVPQPTSAAPSPGATSPVQLPPVRTSAATRAAATATPTPTATAGRAGSRSATATPTATVRPTRTATQRPTTAATATATATAAATATVAATVAPTALPPTATPLPQPTRALNNIAHVVNAGETLSALAAYYGVSLADLAAFNGLRSSDALSVGQVLQVPLPAGAPVPPPPTPPAAPTPTGSGTGSYPPSLVLDAPTPLHFINNGSLLRLDPQSGTLSIVVGAETVVGGLGSRPLLPGGRFFGPGPLVTGSRVVTDFRISEDGQTILVERGLQTADGTQYSLALVNPADGSLTTLIAAAPDLIDIELTADGRYASALRPESATRASVLAFATDRPEQPIVLGDCTTVEAEFGPIPCRALVDDKDSAAVLFVDGEGVWRAPFGGARPTLLFSSSDVAAELAPTTFDPIAWSPSGRYLLTWGLFFEGSQRFIYDDEADRLAAVPFSDAYVFVSSVTWLPDDRLMVLEPSDPAAARRPVLTVFAIDPAADPWLVQEARFAIPTVATYAPGEPEFPGTQMYAPDSYTDEGGLFAIVSSDPAERGLYRVDLEALTVQQIDGWPEPAGGGFFVRETAWPADDAGLLVTLEHTGGGRRAFWLSAATGSITQLDLLGDPCCFTWR